VYRAIVLDQHHRFDGLSRLGTVSGGLSPLVL
jgi:hypothetical protein